MLGNLRYKINWVKLMVGTQMKTNFLYFFSLVLFAFEGYFQV